MCEERSRSSTGDDMKKARFLKPGSGPMNTGNELPGDASAARRFLPAATLCAVLTSG